MRCEDGIGGTEGRTYPLSMIPTNDLTCSLILVMSFVYFQALQLPRHKGVALGRNYGQLGSTSCIRYGGQDDIFPEKKRQREREEAKIFYVEMRPSSEYYNKLSPTRSNRIIE